MFEIDKQTQKISMNEGDFGIVLTFLFDNIEETDIKFKIYEVGDNDKTPIIEKDFKSSEIIDNKIEIELTKEESSKLSIKKYYWGLYQYVDEELKNTLAVDKKFVVKEGV